jgi:hypothetical protein
MVGSTTRTMTTAPTTIIKNMSSTPSARDTPRRSSQLTAGSNRYAMSRPRSSGWKMSRNTTRTVNPRTNAPTNAINLSTAGSGRFMRILLHGFGFRIAVPLAGIKLPHSC